jgi:hypothetical protein
MYRDRLFPAFAASTRAHPATFSPSVIVTFFMIKASV